MFTNPAGKFVQWQRSLFIRSRRTNDNLSIHPTQEGFSHPVPIEAPAMPSLLTRCMAESAGTFGLVFLGTGAIMVDDLSGGRVTIAGSGDRRYHSHLRARFDDSRIEWLSWGAPEEVYQAAGFVVVPSLWHEPLSRVVLEPFSCGVTVSASRRGGITELVREGANGFLFDSECPGDIQKILQRVMQGGVCLSREIRNACLEDAQNFTEN